MQHLSIDDHVFSRINKNALQGSSHKSDGGWKVVNVIENPRLYRTSRDLDTWDLDVVAFKSDGMIEADTLRAKKNEGKAVMITDGQGKSWGQWVIKSISTQYTQIVENGVAQVLKIKISLLEYRQDENASAI